MKLLAAALTLVATQSVAQELPCFNRSEFIQTLDETYGEINIATLEETDGTPLELYVMPNGYWALGILTQDGVVCVVVKGYDFLPQDRGELG